MFRYRWIKILIKNFFEFQKLRLIKNNNFCVNDKIRQQKNIAGGVKLAQL